MAPRASTRRSDPDRAAMRAALRRLRWGAGEARVVLAVHQRSGLSLTAFARQYGLSLQRLITWQKRLRAGETHEVGPTRFLPVTISSADGTERDPRSIEIVVQGGRRVCVCGPFDPTVLASVVEVLERLAC